MSTKVVFGSAEYVALTSKFMELAREQTRIRKEKEEGTRLLVDSYLATLGVAIDAVVEVGVKRYQVTSILSSASFPEWAPPEHPLQVNVQCVGRRVLLSGGLEKNYEPIMPNGVPAWLVADPLKGAVAWP